VEIAKALMSEEQRHHPRRAYGLVLLAGDRHGPSNIVRTVKADRDRGSFYISHHLDEVFCDRRPRDRFARRPQSQHVPDRRTHQDGRWIKDMVGRDPSTFYKRENASNAAKRSWK